jgi:hypothetical protein
MRPNAASSLAATLLVSSVSLPLLTACSFNSTGNGAVDGGTPTNLNSPDSGYTSGIDGEGRGSTSGSTTTYSIGSIGDGGVRLGDSSIIVCPVGQVVFTCAGNECKPEGSSCCGAALCDPEETCLACDGEQTCAKAGATCGTGQGSGQCNEGETYLTCGTTPASCQPGGTSCCGDILCDPGMDCCNGACIPSGEPCGGSGDAGTAACQELAECCTTVPSSEMAQCDDVLETDDEPECQAALTTFCTGGGDSGAPPNDACTVLGECCGTLSPSMEADCEEDASMGNTSVCQGDLDDYKSAGYCTAFGG